MMKGIACENGKQLAQEIYDSLKTKHKKYTLRPFNRFDIEKSMWWIIPSKEFPAYRYGKYMVEENPGGTYSVGTHIEKGLENAFDYKPKLMLDKEWIWYDFIQAVANGEISRLLKAIHDKIEDSAEIIIKIDIPDIKRSRKLILNNQHFIDSETGMTIELESIPQWIKEIEGIEWYWVDFYIYFIIPKINQQVEKKWSGYDIVENLLAPFEQWIK